MTISILGNVRSAAIKTVFQETIFLWNREITPIFWEKVTIRAKILTADLLVEYLDAFFEGEEYDVLYKLR